MDFEKKVRFLSFNIRKNKNEQVVSLIEELGVNVQIEGYDTLLNQAIVYENWDIAKYCIEHDADVNVRAGSGRVAPSGAEFVAGTGAVACTGMCVVAACDAAGDACCSWRG